jgi:hypothetical protein
VIERAPWIAALVALLLGSCPAFAGPNEAQSLFDAGVKEMQDSRFETACNKLERSYELDPLPGVRFTMAVCFERWGKTHTAVKHYERFIADVGSLPPDQAGKHEDRVKNANNSLQTLKPRVPAVTINLDGDATGATVELDDQPLRPSDLGKPYPVDPGDHHVVVKSAGGVREQELHLNDGEKISVALEVPTGPAAPEAEPSQPAAEGEDDDGSALRIAGFVVMGVGIAGTIVGAVTGGLVFAKKGTVEDNCVDNVCNAEGLEAVDDAKTLGMVSNIALPVGLAATAAGLLMVLLAPDGDEKAAGLTVAPAPGGMGVRLRW